MVFDEAHRVRRTKASTTLGYRLANRLKDQVDGMLLLTATPMQLHPYELYSLIELVEPGVCGSFAEYERRRRELPDLVQKAKDLEQWDLLTSKQRDSLSHSFRRRDVDLKTKSGRAAALAILERRHPFALTMIRNRKADIGGFTQRRPVTVSVQLEPDEIQLYKDVSRYLREQYNHAQETQQKAVGFLMVTYQKMLASSSHAVRTALQRRMAKLTGRTEPSEDDATSPAVQGPWRDPRELSKAIEGSDHVPVASYPRPLDHELSRLANLVARLGRVRDSKARYLLDTLRDSIGDKKVIIFTQFIETQMFLKNTLEYHGYSVEIFNGTMKHQGKDSAVRRFRTMSDILISTEAGGEGRNFQFANVMINYDLPWNPMKVEQRIGRLDRIGQQQDVYIYNFFCTGTIEERIIDVLDRRIQLFEESVGSLDPILGAIEEEVTSLIFGSGHSTDEIEKDIEQRVKSARLLEAKTKQLTLDLTIFQPNEANRVVAERSKTGPSNLQRYVAEVLESYGGRLTEHPEGGFAILLSQDLQSLLGAEAGSCRGVFDYREALEYEELDFFAFGHDLIDGIVELPLKQDAPSACHRRIRGHRGGPVVELFYMIEAKGPIRLGRFIQHLVDKRGTVREKLVSSMPELGPEVVESKMDSDWIDEALAISRRKLSSTRNVLEAEARKLHLKWSDEELDRTERIYRYRRRYLERRIEADEQLVQKLETSDAPGDLRVLPAIRGRVAKNTGRLSTLDRGHEMAKEVIRGRRSDISVRMVAAALVVGN